LRAALPVEGSGSEFQINFNDEELLILAIKQSVYRFRRSAVVGFELIARTKLEPAKEKSIKGVH
jgi:hypothetical protein